jgi:RHH-type proline utilization regulon transcriptional repressor/proline dehydrogenase/delta 1-pyrroline-5-carboxylate dehydrogenase
VGYVAPSRWSSTSRRLADIVNEEIFGPLSRLEPVAASRPHARSIEALPFALTGASSRAQPEDGRPRQQPRLVRQPVREPPDHGRDGRTSAVRGQPAIRVRSKAGGPDYLLQFVESRVLTENTMRHGLPLT